MECNRRQISKSSALPAVNTVFEKPSRVTLLRIRYYELKIRLEDFHERLLHRLNKSVFRKLVPKRIEKRTDAALESNHDANPIETAKVPCKDEATASPKSETKFVYKKGKRQSDADDEESELEPGQAPPIRRGSYRHKTVDNSLRRCRGRETHFCNKRRQRKRRSSLTRRRSSGMEMAVEKASAGSGDVQSFEKSRRDKQTPELAKYTGFSIKRAWKRRKEKRKEKKLVKWGLNVHHILEPEADPINVEDKEQQTQIDNPTEEEDTVKDLEPSTATLSDTSMPKVPTAPNPFTLRRTDSKGFWGRLSALANRKRRRDPEYLKPNPLTIGFQIKSSSDYARRKNFKSQRDSAALLETVGENIDTIGKYVSKVSQSISGAIEGSDFYNFASNQIKVSGTMSSRRFQQNTKTLTTKPIISDNVSETLARYYNTYSEVHQSDNNNPSRNSSRHTVPYTPQTQFTAKYTKLLQSQNY